MGERATIERSYDGALGRGSHARRRARLGCFFPHAAVATTVRNQVGPPLSPSIHLGLGLWLGFNPIHLLLDLFSLFYPSLNLQTSNLSLIPMIEFLDYLGVDLVGKQ